MSLIISANLVKNKVYKLRKGIYRPITIYISCFFSGHRTSHTGRLSGSPTIRTRAISHLHLVWLRHTDSQWYELSGIQEVYTQRSSGQEYSVGVDGKGWFDNPCMMRSSKKSLNNTKIHPSSAMCASYLKLYLGENPIKIDFTVQEI